MEISKIEKWCVEFLSSLRSLIIIFVVLLGQLCTNQQSQKNTFWCIEMLKENQNWLQDLRARFARFQFYFVLFFDIFYKSK